ncbi:DNA-directed RNA polymerase, mitochondrial isoform X2 [Sorex araneus]|uniref:DNA-directed RNA polymerase, mitochondrial isoform X2 n=1 Tax=Sorex araneus TaxID=42254 RepID=UPI0024336AAE|nr:DNA-directed RNA polymerase, mitochondrial isoform X2 [Sorex araneus]
MSALRWGWGAAGLGRVLRPLGRPGPPAHEGALDGSFWGCRRQSTATRCVQEPRKDWGHAELLEVLEARVRQLQAESVSTVTVVKKVSVKKVSVKKPAVKKLAVKKSDVACPLPTEETGDPWTQEPKEAENPKVVVPKPPRRRRSQLLLEPRLQDKELHQCLRRWTTESPSSPWEEQLAELLRDAPRRLSQELQQVPASTTARARLEAQQQRLLSFLQSCLLSGHLALAHHVLARQHAKLRPPLLLTLPMYNTVMLGWARQGSFKELVYIFYMLKDAGLAPDLLSYAAALQCMGRLDKDAQTVQRCLEQMARDGLQLRELFAQPLSASELEAVLSAVHKAQPGFQPPAPAPAPRTRSTSPLLAEVYAKNLPVTYPKLHLPLKMLQELFQKQLRMEMATIVHVPSVDKAPQETKELQRARKTLKRLRAQWEEELLDALREAKDNHTRLARQGHPSLLPYLSLISERDIVRLLLQTLNAISPHGESLVSMAQDLGLRVFNRYAVHRKVLSNQMQGLEQRYHQYLHLLASDSKVAAPCLPRQHWESLGPPEPPHEQPWPLPVLVELGKQLAEMLVQAVHMPSGLTAGAQDPKRSVPVLYHAYSFRSFRQIGILKPHPAFIELREAAAERMLTFEANEVPMLCPPLPWTSPHMGAFLLSPTKLMRSMEGVSQHLHLLDSCPPQDLHGALDTVTQLGNCAWRVRGPVLDLVLELFTAKGCPRLGVPAPPSEAPRPPSTRLPPGTPPARKAELRREVGRCLKVTREMHSLRADALYRLSLAQHLRHQTFWLPHNMDFRGRTYPCPPHFNHLGSDLARALLEFAEGRPLGPQGLDWLKIHLVNLTGFQKRASLQARRNFADKVMDDILDSADRPMTGRKWWMEADEPWQALACCMEIAKVVRSPDPVAYVSHFPVHQDGSCNGLQHYAALGRDSVGAAAVNLVPSDLPQDVYSEVAAQVEVFRSEDAKQGVRVAQVLDGFISRKVVKQTVMTVVYGVTRYGGRLQIEKRLRELDDFPQEFVWEASHYLVRKVFSSLQEMFSGSRAIQNWLTETARLISKSGSAVEWVTPLGIPIIQPYHVGCKVLIGGGLQSLTISNSGDTNRKGLTFVSVHDCFWTHAADVPVMNQVCREQFVRLHSHPILQNLSSFLTERFCTGPRAQRQPSKLSHLIKLRKTLMAVPKRGTLNLAQVKGSTYFFS